MRAFRDELDAAGDLAGNPPTPSMTVSWGSSRGITRSLLAGEDVDVDEGIDAQMLALSEALYEKVQATPSDSKCAALAELWATAVETLEFWDSNVAALDAKVEQPVWGHISNAIERIAGAAAYAPGIDGMPSMEQLLAMLRRLWASRFPQEKESGNESSSLSWGNWEVRVYAADAYVSLAYRFGEAHGEIVEMFDAILADPVPQVRLKTAQSLQVLSRIALPKMWELAERIARDEPHTGVLSSFLHYVMPRFTWHDARRSLRSSASVARQSSVTTRRAATRWPSSSAA